MSFAPVRLSILRGDQKIGFEVFVEVASKHLLLLHKGDSFEGERLTRLKKKNLKKIFIRSEDEPLLRDYMARNIEQAYDKSSKQSVENRVQIIQGIQQSSTEAVFENPEDKVAYDSAKQGSQKFAAFLLAEDNAVKKLLAVENTDQNLAHHGVSVASLAVAIAKETGYKDLKNLSLIALGGMLHDLGHLLSGQNVAQPRESFSPEEIKIYQNHPTTGAQKLKDLKHMDIQITQIILEHEENVNGGGFPGKLGENKLNPMSIFVESANIFDRLVTFEKLSQTEAVKQLMTKYIGRYPLAHFNAIKAIVKSVA